MSANFTDIFQCIFLYGNCCILIKISVKFVPNGAIGSGYGLVPNRLQAIIRTNDGPFYKRIYFSHGSIFFIDIYSWGPFY